MGRLRSAFGCLCGDRLRTTLKVMKEALGYELAYCSIRPVHCSERGRPTAYTKLRRYARYCVLVICGLKSARIARAAWALSASRSTTAIAIALAGTT
jgi:hypothetical protein